MNSPSIQFRYSDRNVKRKQRSKTMTHFAVSEKERNEVFVDANGEKTVSLGAGNYSRMTRRKLAVLVRRVIALAKTEHLKKIELDFDDLIFPQLGISDKEYGEILGANLELANFEFTRYKTAPKEGWQRVTEILFLNVNEDVKAGLKKGHIIGQEVNASRTLANTPGGEMTPSILADSAKKAASGLKISVKILGRKEMRKLGMGAVLGVASGSDNEPKFIIMEYRGGNTDEKPVVLVGKGVTFDTGGLNLKPEGGIYEMHLDMSGGAAVIHTITLAAKLKIKKNIVALVPAVENMPSGSSYRPGDVLKSLSGKTIEILNTDAEGRVILADALEYAKKYNPKLVIDVATLTGASIVALGQRASAIFTKSEKLEKKFRELGEKSDDHVWPLPLWDEYEEEVKGTFGDVANLGKYKKGGGAITAAIFLYQFAKEYPWVHIDMAPRMTAIDGEYLAKGSVGAPIRLLIKFLEETP